MIMIPIDVSEKGELKGNLGEKGYSLKDQNKDEQPPYVGVHPLVDCGFEEKSFVFSLLSRGSSLTS